ncbi:uncharacterized protein SAPINGB_P003256 [Magnusiomyces paraingens]|uniref:Uncharacterized protein n=1 Tax=Magnusiomyces paraingens TaxID=2606893 RepID=A0A5E8BQW7_9ASCO|nr:uncharacterized protein SAPINGB_P003256 [Saprochaete ingens]VVT51917.1 unnamed protein product [Saprochaete ingens]
MVKSTKKTERSLKSALKDSTKSKNISFDNSSNQLDNKPAQDEKNSSESKSPEAEATKGTEEKSKLSKMSTLAKMTTPVFRVVTGSYEHSLLCLSLSLYDDGSVFTPIFHFTPHIQSIRCLARSKRYLVSGSNDEHIRIYDLQKRKELGTLMQHEGSVTVLEFFDNKWLLSAGDDGKICLWRTRDWEVLGELKGHKAGGITDISIHPSGKIAISAGGDHTLRLWNLMTCRKASVLKLGRDLPRKVQWTSLKFDKAAHYVVGFDKKVVVYSSENATPVGKTFVFRSTLQHMELYILDDVEYVVTSHDNGSVNFIPLTELLKEPKEGEEEISAEGLPESAFKLQGHASRVKHFSFFYSQPRQTTYMSTVSSSGMLVIWNLNKDVRDQVAAYQTGNRLNCCIMFPDDIERFETMKKRRRINDDGDFLSEAEETDFSEAESDFESDFEGTKPTPASKSEKKRKNKKKTKKPKVTVEFE